MAVAIYGDREVVSQMLFGSPSPQLQEYIHQTNQYFQTQLSDVGRTIVNTAKDTFARMNASEAMELARIALRKVNVYLQNDVIYQTMTIAEVQEAPSTMVRWIMCHPQLQTMYHENRIDGYGDRYTTSYPVGCTGWDNPDYARVYEGWLEEVTETVINEDGEEVEETYVEWVETLEDWEGDIELLDIEAGYIRQAHELVDIALEQGRDPTSFYDSQVL